LAEIIRAQLPQFAITGSTLMGVSRPAQALLLGGVLDSLTPDTSILRDLRALRQLRDAFSGELRLIVNEGCLPGCLYRTQHFYEMGYGDFFPASLCLPLLEMQPWLRLTGAWVLPQHLAFYDGLYDTLKLAGRVTLRDPIRYLTVLGAYVERKPLLPRDVGGGPASVVAPIGISDSLFETILNCDKNCFRCSTCRDYYNRAVAIDGGNNATTC
jgi:hypothetical protein